MEKYKRLYLNKLEKETYDNDIGKMFESAIDSLYLKYESLYKKNQKQFFKKAYAETLKYLAKKDKNRIRSRNLVFS